MTMQEAGAQAAPSKLARVTQIALWVNAVAHFTGTVGMAFGLGPHAAEQSIMARRAAAAGVAALVMFVFVSSRLRRDPALVALPWAFVFCNFADTLFEFSLSHDPQALAPAAPEATFLVIYSVFAANILRARRGRVA